MKLTSVLLTALVIHASAIGTAQNVTYSANNVPIEQVFMEIKNQTGYFFLYTESVLKKAKPVTIAANNMPIQQFLEELFENQPLAYTIASRTITVTSTTKVEPNTIHIPDIIALAPFPIKVTDPEGNPLSGATVSIPSKKISGITDAKGEITIEAEAGDVIVVSFIGHQPYRITVTSAMLSASGSYTIALKRAEAELDAVEVTINTGYQHIKPEHSTGSTFTLGRKEYESRINTLNFLDGLQNKIPGLLINNEVQFEGNGLFQIRGISTIKGNRNPLIVLDGYPTELSLDQIDPNDIETVTVLRDAAAATVYGARSSNGVIIIERKKAKAGELRVNFRATTSFRPKEDYSRYRWADNASDIVVEYEKFRNMNALGTVWPGLSGSGGGNRTDNPAALIMLHWRSNTNPISEQERDRQLAELASYNNSSEYSKLFLRTASTQTYNMDMSGGSDRILYFLTANYSHNNAMQVKNDDNIFRISGRTTMKFSDRFSLDLNTDFQEKRQTKVPVPDINRLYPYERFRDENGNELAVSTGSRTTPNYNSYLLSLGLLDNMYYPLRDLNEVSDKSRTSRNRITADFRYKFAPGFNLSFGGVYESARNENRHMATEASTEVRQLINVYAKPITGGFNYNIPKGTLLKQQSGNVEGYTLRAQLNYDKTVAKDHSLNMILGAEVRKLLTTGYRTAYFGYNDRTLIQQPVDYKVLFNNFAPSYANANTRLVYNDLFRQEYTDDRFISGYSNIVYSYKGKYSATGSIRVDQSNLFGTDPKYRYKPLWSLGAAWNIHKEDFMQDIFWIKDMKLRVAHGFNGNVAKDALPQVIASDILNTLNPSSPIPALALLSHANSGLRWEQTKNTNIGLNFSIFNNITGSIDYYLKTSTDILANNQIDASKGGVSALVNEASIRNRGLEISLQADWITKRRFNWNTGFIFAHNKSKVLEVYNSDINASSGSWQYITGSYSNYLKGYSVGAIFNYRYAGLDNTGYPQIYDSNGDSKRLFTDDAKVNDVAYVGSSIPVINLGLSNRFDIGNFYIYGMINYYGKFRVRVPIPNASDMRPMEGADNYWKQAGDETDPDVLPDIRVNAGIQNYFFIQNSDKYTVNGSYLTVGDLTAAYSFRGSSFLNRTGLRNLEIKVQASNIYTVGFNKYNYSLGTGSFAKRYITPTYAAAISINF